MSDVVAVLRQIEDKISQQRDNAFKKARYSKSFDQSFGEHVAFCKALEIVLETHKQVLEDREKPI